MFKSKFFKTLTSPYRFFLLGWRMGNNSTYHSGREKSLKEKAKQPERSAVINLLLNQFKHETTYLEIGVRNPEHNFNKIKANQKYSVDPGVEFEENPVDFKMTSDDFFNQLNEGKILNQDIKFDVIFVDGLHLADQVEKDVANALHFVKEDGFIVMHDCNPPTEWHAREAYDYHFTPAKGHWNGTTWKAFLKVRTTPEVNSCCVDTDWGVGIISKNQQIGKATKLTNPFFEFKIFENNRKEFLNLISFTELENRLNYLF